MSKVSIQGDISGTGDFTIKAPNSNTDRTLTIPDSDGEFLFTDSNGDLSVDGKVGIGTTNPVTPLEVETGASGVQPLLSLTQRDSTPGNEWGIDFRRTDSNSADSLAAQIYTAREGGVANGLRFNYVNGSVEEGMSLDSSGNFKFDSGYGSVATAYGCRAWVNWDGTGTPSIRDSGNVSSITDNGTGDYTVNFATAMPDNSYSFFGMVASTNDNWSSRATNPQRGASGVHQHPLSQPTSTSIRVETLFGTQEGSDGGLLDFSSASISIFR